MPLGTEIGLGPGNTVRWDQPPPKRGTAPNFQPMSVVAKWSSISATTEQLFYRPGALLDTQPTMSKYDLMTLSCITWKLYKFMSTFCFIHVFFVSGWWLGLVASRWSRSLKLLYAWSAYYWHW